MGYSFSWCMKLKQRKQRRKIIASRGKTWMHMWLEGLSRQLNMRIWMKSMDRLRRTMHGLLVPSKRCFHSKKKENNLISNSINTKWISRRKSMCITFTIQRLRSEETESLHFKVRFTRKKKKPSKSRIKRCALDSVLLRLLKITLINLRVNFTITWLEFSMFLWN